MPNEYHFDHTSLQRSSGASLSPIQLLIDQVKMGKHKQCCNFYKCKHTRKQHNSAREIKDLEKCRALYPKFPWELGMRWCWKCRRRFERELELLKNVRKGVDNAKKANERRKKNDEPSTSAETRSDNALALLPTFNISPIPQSPESEMDFAPYVSTPTRPPISDAVNIEGKACTTLAFCKNLFLTRKQ